MLNAPGVAGTVATSFDGYAMARKALTIAAIASFAGGTIGKILLKIFAPALSSVALVFHSAEYFALMVVGLSASAAFAATGQVGKALMMTILGLVMGMAGEGTLSNMPRFTCGIMELHSGFSFITLAMAMFALPEALFLVLNPARAAPSSMSRCSRPSCRRWGGWCRTIWWGASRRNRRAMKTRHPPPRAPFNAAMRRSTSPPIPLSNGLPRAACAGVFRPVAVGRHPGPCLGATRARRPQQGPDPARLSLDL